jgi:hypothetical protein
VEDCEEGYYFAEEIIFSVTFSVQLSPMLFDN